MGLGLEGLGDGLGGDADDLIRAKLGADVPGLHVALAHVDAIGVHGQGDVYVVVDDKGHAVGSAEGFDVFRFVQEVGLVQVLLPELEEGHAAVQALLHDLVQGPAVQPVPVGDGVEQ